MSLAGRLGQASVYLVLAGALVAFVMSRRRRSLSPLEQYRRHQEP